MPRRIFQVLNSDEQTFIKLKNRLKNMMAKPTDYIEMAELEREKLAQMFFEFDETSQMLSDTEPPSDIVIANTVPLRHFEISGERGSGCGRYKYRFSIFDFNEAIPLVFSGYDIEKDTVEVGSFTIPETVTDRMEYISRGDSILIVGVVTIEECDTGVWSSFSLPIIAKHNAMALTPIIFDVRCKMPDGKIKTYAKHDGILDFSQEEGLGSLIVFEGQIALETLYAVECALLNPVILNVFTRRETKVPIDDASKSNKSGYNKRAKVRYVKKHYLRADEIKNELKAHGFTRKAMIWYVTGHWREYKNGKRIFIQGYWKGALRNAKETLFPDLESRERELVTDEKEDKHEH